MMWEHMSDAVLLERKRRRRRRIASVVMGWLLALFIIAAAGFCAATIAMAVGGIRLREDTRGARPNIAEEAESDGREITAVSGEVQEPAESVPTEASVIWQEGWVRHNDRIYEYNEDIMTFLVLGIDEMGQVEESNTATGGGQSDAIFLVIANPDTEQINILVINRDTMTKIRMCGMGSEGGDPTIYAQIAIQHGFGDGMELSCELTADAVSALLYDLPIHGYVAVNMGAISRLNDTIGGVEVTVLEDLTKVSRKLKEGEQITLMGNDAFLYVKWRDTDVFESNRGRLARQKQYLEAFAGKVVEAVKQDITLPVTLYQELSKYIVTDITVDELAFLAGELTDYSLGEDAVYTLEGTTRMGETYEEFYPDKAAMRELMITLFYREVEQ